MRHIKQSSCLHLAQQQISICRTIGYGLFKVVLLGIECNRGYPIASVLYQMFRVLDRVNKYGFLKQRELSGLPIVECTSRRVVIDASAYHLLAGQFVIERNGLRRRLPPGEARRLRRPQAAQMLALRRVGGE